MWHLQYIIPLFKNKEKISFLTPLVKNPLFSAIYIYLLNFSFIIVRKKSGKVTKMDIQELRTPINRGFQRFDFWSNPFLKVGRNRAFDQKSDQNRPYNRPKLSNFCRICPHNPVLVIFTKPKVGKI